MIYSRHRKGRTKLKWRTGFEFSDSCLTKQASISRDPLSVLMYSTFRTTDCPQ